MRERYREKENERGKEIYGKVRCLHRTKRQRKTAKRAAERERDLRQSLVLVSNETVGLSIINKRHHGKDRCLSDLVFRNRYKNPETQSVLNNYQ